MASYIYGTESGTISSGITYVMPGGEVYSQTIVSGDTEIIAAGGTVGTGGAAKNTYSSTENLIDGGTLVLQTGAVVDANIAFGSGFAAYGDTSGGLLVIEGTTSPSLVTLAPTTPTIQIQGFTFGNTIDLAAVPYSSAGTTSYNSSTDVLQITENGNSYDLQLDAYVNYDYTTIGATFILVPDQFGGTDVVEAVSVSTFTANYSTGANLDTDTGVAISDTAANVYSNLATLEADASHIGLIQATGGPVTVSDTQFDSDQAALNLIVGGFSISDLASTLSGDLTNLEADASHINSITGTGGTITASSVGQFLSDETVLNKVVGGFAISDISSNIHSNLGALTLDASHIASITSTSGQITVGNALFFADEAALNEIVGGFWISGQASVLSGDLNNLEADSSHIHSIIGANGTITAPAAEFLSDLTALNEVVGGYNVDIPSGYEIDVTYNAATNISAADLILSGTVSLIFDGTTAQNITMTTQEYNGFTTITDGASTTAANSTVSFSNSGTVTTNSAVGNYDLAATGGDTITIGTSGTVNLGSHSSADTVIFGTATSTASVTGWNYALDILKVSAIGTGVSAASPADLTYDGFINNALTMGQVNFVTDLVNVGGSSEDTFYTNLAHYGTASSGELNTGATAANAILIVNDGTDAVDDVFYVVGNGAHGATSVALVGTYDLATAHFAATILG